jgi:hypothetical protein
MLALAACTTASEERPWTVRQVLENRQSLNGKTIVLKGWSDSCQRLSCTLYDSPDEVRKERANYWVSVGGYPSFDQAAAARVPSYVVMVARVKTRCMNDPSGETIALCADRPSSIVPLRILRWSKSGL